MAGGAYVSATIDIGDVEKGLSAMSKRAKSLGSAFDEIKVAMKADQKDHREQQSGPEGSWQGRAMSTIAAAKRHHRRLPRKILGKLPTAVSYKALPYGAFGESRVKWSLSQQDGGRVGHGAKLPERAFLWLSDKLLDFAANVVTKSLESAWGGR